MRISNSKLVHVYQIGSIFWSVVGGFMLASNIEISPYGFVFTAMGSLSFAIASFIKRDFLNLLYGATLLFVVDLLGAFRWIVVW